MLPLLLIMACTVIGLDVAMLLQRGYGARWPFLAALGAALVIVASVVVAPIVGPDRWNEWFGRGVLGILWAWVLIPLALLGTIGFTAAGMVLELRARGR